MPAVPSELAADVDVQSLLDAVTRIESNASDAVLIDRIAALERLKSGCAAAQARLTATFADSVTADAAARKQRMDVTRRSIGGQIGLARRDSPFAGRRHVGVAAALVNDMPHSLAALACGDLSERRARIVVEQLACLTSAHRREADQLLAPELARLGDRTAETRAAAVAARLDPETVMAKVRGAVKDRHVSLRPAPDAMSRLSGLLPVTLGVAVYAALCKAAATATAMPGGDSRNRGQLMADALVSAVTGQQIIGCDPYGVPHYAPAASDPAASNPAAAADVDDDDAVVVDIAAADAPTAGAPEAPAPEVSAPGSPSTDTAVAIRGCTAGCGISINLVMTDRTLLDSDDEPAYLHGIGPIPAALARALVIGSADTSTRTFIRRLYADPVTGRLDAMDSKRRLFPAAAQRFLLARDQTCRTPWCDAPIRQYDHVQSHADGGPTTIINAQGQCQACNLTKDSPRWFARSSDGTIHLTVPTGHTYASPTPPPPRSQPWAEISHTEHRFAKALLWSA